MTKPQKPKTLLEVFGGTPNDTPKRTWRIELGHLPHRNLNPNARVHWRTVAKAKSDAKEEAWALSHVYGVPDKPYAQAHMTVTYVGDKRNRDMDNLLAATKGYIDGIVAAKVVKDDSVFVLSYSLHYEVGKPNTIIEIEEIG